MTEYVDLFLLHDPDPSSVRSAELRAFLDSRVSAGQLVRWGVAGPAADVSACLGELQSPQGVAQIRYDITSSESLRMVGKETDLVLFGVLGAPLADLRQRLRAPSSAPAVEDALDIAGVSPDDFPTLLIQDALLQSHGGTVLVGTRNPVHIVQATEARQALFCGDQPARTQSAVATLRALLAGTQDLLLSGDGQ